MSGGLPLEVTAEIRPFLALEAVVFGVDTMFAGYMQLSGSRDEKMLDS